MGLRALIGAYTCQSEGQFPRWHTQRLSDCLNLPFEQLLLLSLCKHPFYDLELLS